MGPIRRSISKRKAEAEPAGQPAAAVGEARGGKPVRFVLRSSDSHRPPPQPQPHASASQANQIRALKRPRSPRTYRFLNDLSLGDAVPRLTREEKKVDKCVKETRKSVATSEELITIPVQSCQDISHAHHPSEDNVALAAMVKCKTGSVVSTLSVSVTPLDTINDVLPNLLPSNATSDTGNKDHIGGTGLLGNMAATQQPNADGMFSAISLPALKGDITSTQSPKKNIAAEDQQRVSLEDQESPMAEYTANTQSPDKNLAAEEQQAVPLEDQGSPMTEYTAESSQSIGLSAVNQLFSTYLGKYAEAEHDNRLTSPKDTEGTLSKCVASGKDNSYCPLSQQSLVDETTITDQPSESLSIKSQPFFKTLPLWKHFEEMEIFKKIPQRPHFHPLKKLGPDLCESMAIGWMIFFGKTAETIRSLNIQDDNELFKEKLKGLSMLEEHGFDVRDLRSRLETLMSIKNKCCQLGDKIKRSGEKIALKEIDGKQLDAQIDILDMTIRQLERQAEFFRCILKSSVSQTKTDVLEISRLKKEGCDLKQSCLSIDEQFSRVVTAPWWA